MFTAILNLKLHVHGTMRLMAAAVILFASYAPAQAASTLQFYSVSNTNPVNVAAGAAQLFVDVTDPSGLNNVLFTFRNLGPIASSIGEIYFDDGSLLAQSTITNSIVGVTNFTGPGANPGNLPAGNNASPAFSALAQFSSDAQGNPSNGVNPGDRFSILYTLQGTQEYADVIAELQDGRLRVGLHVRAFADGNSESFVNLPLSIAAIPEPSTMALFGLGTLLLWRRRGTRTAGR